LADLAVGRIGGPLAGAYVAGRQRALELARRLDDTEALYRVAELTLLYGEIGRQGEEVRFADECLSRKREGIPTRTLATVLRHSQLVYLAAGLRGRAEEVWHDLEQLVSRTQ